MPARVGSSSIGSSGNCKASVLRERVVGIAVEPLFARLRRCDHRMLCRVRVFGCVRVRRAVAAERRAAVLTRPQVDPSRMDVDALVALAMCGVRDVRDRADMPAGSLWHRLHSLTIVMLTTMHARQRQNAGRVPISVTICLAFVLAGCGSHTPPQTAPAAAPALPDSITWILQSAEYPAAFAQTYRQATAYVEQQSTGRTAGSWAVVLDADETVISNVQYQIERSRAGLGFTQESWTAWVRRREARPLPGAARFLARARELGGRIAIVTNRLQSECDDTIAVFRAHQLVFDAMLCRLDGTPSDKNPRFAAVAAGLKDTGGRPLEILAFVGDNILDFPSLTQAIRQRGEAALSDFGVRYFVLPNPMYGSWQ